MLLPGSCGLALTLAADPRPKTGQALLLRHLMNTLRAVHGAQVDRAAPQLADTVRGPLRHVTDRLPNVEELTSDSSKPRASTRPLPRARGRPHLAQPPIGVDRATPNRGRAPELTRPRARTRPVDLWPNHPDSAAAGVPRRVAVRPGRRPPHLPVGPCDLRPDEGGAGDPGFAYSGGGSLGGHLGHVGSAVVVAGLTGPPRLSRPQPCRCVQGARTDGPTGGVSGRLPKE